MLDNLDLSRLKVIPGDIAHPNLSLSDASYTSLGRKVDVVIHNAAAVNWVASYQQLKDSNVAGTMRMLEFCQQEKVKPIHFISSISIFYSTHYMQFNEVAETTELSPHSNHIIGYFKSKWIADALVCNAFSQGQAGTIHRPSFVTPAIDKGIFSADDAIALFIQGCCQMNMMPVRPLSLNMVPVDRLADAVIFSANSLHTPGHRIFHHVSPESLRWTDFMLSMQRIHPAIEFAEYATWKSNLITNTSGNKLNSLLALFISASPDSAFQDIFEFYTGHNLSIDFSQQARALDQSVNLPPCDTNLIQRYIKLATESLI